MYISRVFKRDGYAALYYTYLHEPLLMYVLTYDPRKLHVARYVKHTYPCKTVTIRTIQLTILQQITEVLEEIIFPLINYSSIIQ